MTINKKEIINRIHILIADPVLYEYAQDILKVYNNAEISKELNQMYEYDLMEMQNLLFERQYAEWEELEME